MNAFRLKLFPSAFVAIIANGQRFMLFPRADVHGVEVGDRLDLREVDRSSREETGRNAERVVTRVNPSPGSAFIVLEFDKP